MKPGDVSAREIDIVVGAMRELRRTRPGLDEDEQQAVQEALISVVQQGVRLGAVEVVAQLDELGAHNIHLKLWDEPALTDPPEQA